VKNGKNNPIKFITNIILWYSEKAQEKKPVIVEKIPGEKLL